ncbi:hypothetical protein [Streptomyces albicerus]|uniref:hypothetical protein n=1 Tax=Streptomyces albicerus TaxID=2569859 RepID=UPI001CEC1761|nr:hypothetical protein [Streptomyces albicerus]
MPLASVRHRFRFVENELRVKERLSGEVGGSASLEVPHLGRDETLQHGSRAVLVGPRWSMAPDERAELRIAHPGVVEVRALRLLGRVIGRQHRISVYRSFAHAVTRVRFAGGAG